MEIINAHAHIYPTKIAERATCAIGDFYDIKMQMPAGTTNALIESGSKISISKYVVHSCATKPQQVHSINEFIKSELDMHPEFIGFMTLHQFLTEDEMKKEIDWALENGFRGVKLHPDFQKFYIDGEDAEKFYRAVNSIGKVFPILLHTGDDRYEYSKPIRLSRMAEKYPNVIFIGAHFGGYRCWDDYVVYKDLKNVFFDTSSSLPFINVLKAKEIIDALGYERFFFGDDFPMWDAEEELKRFMRIPISDEQKKAILADNFKKLLSL